MIQMRTILEVADNSGAKKISCIQLRGGSQGQYAELGVLTPPDEPGVKSYRAT